MRNASGALLALAMVCAAPIVRAQAPSTPAAAPGASPPASTLTGDWMLDENRSDTPPAAGREGGRGRRGGFRGGGDMGGENGPGAMGGGFGRRGRGSMGETGRGDGERGPRPVRLPARVHVTQTETMVSFEDTTGVVLEEIATVPAAADTFTRAPGAVHRLGAWNGSALALTRGGPGGATVEETWSLADSGASLVSVIRIEGGTMPARTMRRVYRRVSGP